MVGQSLRELNESIAMSARESFAEIVLLNRLSIDRVRGLEENRRRQEFAAAARAAKAALRAKNKARALKLPGARAAAVTWEPHPAAAPPPSEGGAVAGDPRADSVPPTPTSPAPRTVRPEAPHAEPYAEPYADDDEGSANGRRVSRLMSLFEPASAEGRKCISRPTVIPGSQRCLSPVGLSPSSSFASPSSSVARAIREGRERPRPPSTRLAVSPGLVPSSPSTGMLLAERDTAPSPGVEHPGVEPEHPVAAQSVMPDDEAEPDDLLGV
jgi:hypothetical protein